MSAGARVLVVDDDRDGARLLAEVLGAAGFDTGTVADTASATRAVLHEDVAVVLSSSRRCGVAGTIELVVDLRSRPETPLRDAGIVALVDDERDARFGLGVEADAVLVRPVPVERLADAVTEVASLAPEQRRRRRHAAAVAQGAAGQDASTLSE